jgi:hypothetical protein
VLTTHRRWGLVTSVAVIGAVVVLLMLWLRTATAPGAALAALGGAVLITLADRDAQLPDQPTGTSGALTDETLG